MYTPTQAKIQIGLVLLLALKMGWDRTAVSLCHWLYFYNHIFNCRMNVYKWLHK
jgi:hypothetical protein